jgi:hypothetical protein
MIHITERPLMRQLPYTAFIGRHPFSDGKLEKGKRTDLDSGLSAQEAFLKLILYLPTIPAFHGKSAGALLKNFKGE